MTHAAKVLAWTIGWAMVCVLFVVAGALNDGDWRRFRGWLGSWRRYLNRRSERWQSN